MKKSIKYIFIISSLILIKLIMSFTINEIIIRNYNNEIYNSYLIKTLYLFNFSQPYIAYYNDGNILYKTGKYETATEKYDKALTKNPPQNKICDIRINKSLAMIKQIDSINYKDAYDKLEEAKNNLYNNNCANPIDDSGYSQEAEQLEKEIKDLQDQLNSSSNDNQQNNQEDDDQQQEQDEQDEYSEIEEELKEIEKESNSNRQSDMSTYENMGDYSYYSGKRW